MLNYVKGYTIGRIMSPTPIPNDVMSYSKEHVDVLLYMAKRDLHD